MVEQLHTLTSTLMVKIPQSILIPGYQEKTRVKKTILRTIIRTLQTGTLELMYVGYKPNYVMDYIEAAPLTENITIVSINVLDDNGQMCDFDTSQEMLLRRFKKELQQNSEHIVIDRTTERNGKTERCIDIYIKSRYSHKPASMPHYTLAMSSGFYSDYQGVA